MSEEVLKSYRLTSMAEPTDEMLNAIMEKVAQAARESSLRAEQKSAQMLADTLSRIKAKKMQK